MDLQRTANLPVQDLYLSRMRWAGPLRLMMMLSFPALAFATTSGVWEEVSATGSAPAPRAYGATAWSPSQERIYVFAGHGPSPDFTRLNDLHVYSTAAATWQQPTPTGSSPGARTKTVAVWNPSAEQMYVFGGAGEIDAPFFNGLWAYKSQDNAWEQLSPSGSPPSERHGHSAVWDDSENRMYIFAGLQDSPRKRMQDLSYYHSTSNSWQSLSPGGTTPGKRHLHSAVWSPDEKRMYVFAGKTYSSYVNDLHYYDATLDQWQQVSPGGTVPTIRAGHSAVWDTNENKMCIFGGIDSGDNYLNDLHCYIRSTNLWEEFFPMASSSPPEGRSYHRAVLNPSDGKMYILEGRGANDHWHNDLHTYQMFLPTTTTTATTSTTRTTTLTSTTRITTTSRASASTTTRISATSSLSGSSSTKSTVTASAATSTTTAFSMSYTYAVTTTATTSTTRTTTLTSTTTETSTVSATTSRTTVTTTGTSATSTRTMSMSTSTGTVTTSLSSSTSMTATTTTRTWTVADLAAVTESIQAETESVVEELLSSGSQKATTVTAMGTVTAVALNISSSIIEVEAEESPAAVILPQEALPVQGNLDAERILTVVPLTGEATKTTLGEGSKAEFGGKSVELAVDAVDVSLFEVLGGQSSAISIDDAPSPIFLRLSDQNAEPDWRCAYLDGEVWSREGVRLASAAEISALYGDSVNTSGVWCATTHLSIFGILIDTLLDCTNLNVLSQEGLEQVFHRTTWWTLLPAVSLWLLTAALLFLVLVGVAQDAKMRRAGFWRDEYFLTEVAPVSATVEMSRAMSSTSRQMSRVMSWITAERAEKSDGDVDGKVDGQRIRTLRPSLRQQLQETLQCQNTLRAAARLHGLHGSTIQSHIWGQTGWVQGSLAVARSPLLKKLVLEMEVTLPSMYLAVHSSFWARCWSTCLVMHPFYELFQWDIHISAAKRAKVTMDSFLGALAFAAIFFSVDGSAVASRRPSECPVPQGSVLWYVLASSVAVLLNSLPCGLARSLAHRSFVQASPNRRRQLRMRLFWDTAFWAVGFCLSILHLLIIVAFLANLGEEHEWKWMTSFAFVVLRKLFVVPLLACIISLGPELLCCACTASPRTAPKSFGLDMELLDEPEVQAYKELREKTAWDEKVEELAGRGITVRQLLDFYSLLGSDDVMPGFDPVESTTHDVVRQAIIPLSLNIHPSRAFQVVLHGISQRGQVLNLQAASIFCMVLRDSVPKPWKVSVCGPVELGEAFLVEGIVAEEALQLRIQDDEASDEGNAKMLTLSSRLFWSGCQSELEVENDSNLFLSLSISVRRGSRVSDWECCASAGGEEEEGTTLDIPAEHQGRGRATLTTDHSQDDVEDGARKDMGDRSQHAQPAQLDPAYSCGPTACMACMDQVKCDHQHPESISQMELFGCSSVPVDRQSTTIEVKGLSYATSVNNGEPQMAIRMVTHSWGNRFTYLLSAIFSDALEAETYDGVADLLRHGKLDDLAEKLRNVGKLDVPYWVCAFSVNQHAGICATPPPTDTTGYPIIPCACTRAKHFSGDFSEMNKFDDMMAYLKRYLREKSIRELSYIRLQQVVAMEVNFSLLTRVWCVAELVEANNLHLTQTIKLHSAASQQSCLDKIMDLDVAEAQASFPADKELVLSKIEDIPAFNNRLQNLLLHRLEGFLDSRAVGTAHCLDDVVLAVLQIMM